VIGFFKDSTLVAWRLSTLLGLASTAHAQEPLPNMLWRVAPSIVQVHVGGQWGSGFVYRLPGM
jgi:hypothetical protein